MPSPLAIFNEPGVMAVRPTLNHELPGMVERYRVAFHFIPLIQKLCRKKLAFPDPGKEDMVTRPERQGLKPGIRNPFQVPFGVLM